MTTIDVDFDVFKELTNRRETEAMTYNDVIRRLLELPAARNDSNPSSGLAWVQKGVVFPDGTEFRATYKGKTYTARVVGNQMVMNGQTMNSFSEAAAKITNTSVNGWRFWEFRRPGTTGWRTAENLKDKD